MTLDLHPVMGLIAWTNASKIYSSERPDRVPALEFAWVVSRGACRSPIFRGSDTSRGTEKALRVRLLVRFSRYSYSPVKTIG